MYISFLILKLQIYAFSTLERKTVGKQYGSSASVFQLDPKVLPSYHNLLRISLTNKLEKVCPVIKGFKNSQDKHKHDSVLTPSSTLCHSEWNSHEKL